MNLIFVAPSTIGFKTTRPNIVCNETKTTHDWSCRFRPAALQFRLYCHALRGLRGLKIKIYDLSCEAGFSNLNILHNIFDQFYIHECILHILF